MTRSVDAPSPNEGENLPLEQMRQDLEAKLKRSGCTYHFSPDHPSGHTFIVTNLSRKFFFDEIDKWFFPRLHELNITGETIVAPDRGPIIERGRFSFWLKKE